MGKLLPLPFKSVHKRSMGGRVGKVVISASKSINTRQCVNASASSQKNSTREKIRASNVVGNGLSVHGRSVASLPLTSFRPLRMWLVSGEWRRFFRQHHFVFWEETGQDGQGASNSGDDGLWVGRWSRGGCRHRRVWWRYRDETAGDAAALVPTQETPWSRASIGL